ncbi:MAG: hypothetical protein K9L30_11560 [Desulfobacterales bacterium]|nr:hypothetical protein [Desulfobacterales bacterium]
MGGDTLKTIKLDNGLNINIIDESKEMVGDRWKISVVVKIDIPVEDHMPDKNLPDVSPAELKKVIGDTVIFEKKQERIFVDDREKDGVISGLIDSFEKEILGYVSSPNFPKRFIVKHYNETLKKEQLSKLAATSEAQKKI